MTRKPRAAVDPDEVARFNRGGRLHPSQTGRVLTGSGGGIAVLLLGVFCIAVYPVTPSYSKMEALICGLLFLAIGLYVAGRYYLEWLIGRVKPVSGWTHVEARDGEQIRYTGGGGPDMRKLGAAYSVNVGTRTFKIDRELYLRIQPDQVNIAFVTLFTHRAVNIVPQHPS